MRLLIGVGRTRNEQRGAGGPEGAAKVAEATDAIRRLVKS